MDHYGQFAKDERQIENTFYNLQHNLSRIDGKLRRCTFQAFSSGHHRLAKFNLKRRNLSTPYSPKSLDELCSCFPSRVQRIFQHLDLDLVDLKDVKQAAEEKDWPLACEALLAYYRNKFKESEQIPVDISNWEKSETPPNLILEDRFIFQGVADTVPRINGWLNWAWTGPHQDREWAWFLNRHIHLAGLVDAYKASQDPAYITCLNNHLVDWLLSSPNRAWQDIELRWRGIEVAYRILYWAYAFQQLQAVSAFSPVAQILMLSSIIDHGRYLRHCHARVGNWITREILGLGTIALIWPEFKQASHWLTYAIGQMEATMQTQVYPDGVHNELTSHYHWVILRDFQQLVDLAHSEEARFSASFMAKLEQMWNYLAYTIRPDGGSLLNNDSDRNNHQAQLLAAAQYYHRPDWAYIVTNGQRGQAPHGLPSYVFPWAGQFITRGSWRKDAQWAFFDVGPMGVFYHEHRDRLHVSISAYGRDLLVDSGRYRYVRDDFWQYFRGSSSHNVILIDGRGQRAHERQWFEPMQQRCLSTQEFDFVQGDFDKGFVGVKDRVIHTRSLIYIRHQFWIVVDHIATDQPHNIQALWHFHPNCTVTTQADSVLSNDVGQGNLRILPVSRLDWQIEIVKGQTSPVQGWWSERYNHKSASSTAVYSTLLEGSTTFAWILYPAQGIPPHLEAKLFENHPNSISIELKNPDGLPQTITIDLDSEKIIDLKNVL